MSFDNSLALEIVAGLASRLEVSMYVKQKPSIIKARLPSRLKTTKPTRRRCMLTGWASIHCISNANWSIGGEKISTSRSESTFSPINLCGVCVKYPLIILHRTSHEGGKLKLLLCSRRQSMESSRPPLAQKIRMAADELTR